MKEPRCAGVLIGYHEHGLGPALLHVAHHADCADVGDDVECGARRVTRAHNAVPVERKGLHAFRCGDVVTFLHPRATHPSQQILASELQILGRRCADCL
eukprot:4589018-Pleurochrysis_carterae.AAC.5